MRFLKVLLLCLLLSACGISNNDNLSLDDILSDNSASKARMNNYSTYIDYYCPSEIHEIESDKTSIVFKLNDSKIIMNVNIAGIINERYYGDYSLSDDGFFDENKLVYSNNNFYYDRDNNEINYYFNLYQYDDVYLLHLANTYVNLYGYCEQKDINLMASKIYDLLKSSEVDITAILTHYSSRDVIEYQKSTVNLFETVMPVEGRIDDMMIDTKDAVSGN